MWGGIPSELYNFATSNFDRTRWTQHLERMRKGMGSVDGGSGGEEALKSYKFWFYEFYNG